MDTREVHEMAAEVMSKQQDLFQAVEADTAAVYALEDAKAQAIIDGSIIGKNAEEREAKAAQVLQPFIGQQRITKAKVAHAKMMLDRAVMNWERVKYTIRLFEVTK